MVVMVTKEASFIHFTLCYYYLLEVENEPISIVRGLKYFTWEKDIS